MFLKFKKNLKVQVAMIIALLTLSFMSSIAFSQRNIDSSVAFNCRGVDSAISAHLSQEYKDGYVTGEKYRLLSIKNIPLDDGSTFDHAVDVSHCSFQSLCAGSKNKFNNTAGWTGAFAINLDDQTLQIGMNFYKIQCN
jgi:hypothetical protein